MKDNSLLPFLRASLEQSKLAVRDVKRYESYGKSLEGCVQMERGYLKEGIEYLKESIAIDPGNAVAYMYLMPYIDATKVGRYRLAKSVRDLHFQRVNIDGLMAGSNTLDELDVKNTEVEVHWFLSRFAFYADEAGRHDEADTYRRIVLRWSTRDSYRNDQFECAHAMMIGDVKRVKVALDHGDPKVGYWCWVKVWLDFQEERSSLDESWRSALEIQPAVLESLLSDQRPAFDDLSPESRSVDDRNDAAILWRGWRPHSDAMSWLWRQGAPTPE